MLIVPKPAKNKQAETAYMLEQNGKAIKNIVAINLIISFYLSN